MERTPLAGRWHGARRYFGLHYDLHAGESDTELGAGATPARLVPALRATGADFAQTDCKGHAGYTSWFSRVPDAAVSPGVKRDQLQGWRAATAQLGLPLHCHYSGIWDAAAGQRHPEWGVVPAAPAAGGGPPPAPQKMCPRGPYLEALMLPQMLELVDRYGVDGFWVDGDIWGVEPCYCERCAGAFREATGIASPPANADHPDWPAWWAFTLDGFERYVTRYCDVLHERRPGVLVCSNWLQTFRHPGAPRVPTDWISGDNTWVFGLDGCRCEARFISTRGKPWDVMIWSFYKSGAMDEASSPWTVKPPPMIQQEAAIVCAFGGNVQVYEHPGNLRDGRLVDWRARRIGQVARFVKARRALCQGTETVPQVAVVHSEHHARSRPGRNLLTGIDAEAVQGAVWSLLECHWGVDVLDEWALLDEGRLSAFPVVVAPEQERMSDAMVAALKAYARVGGRLLVSGAGAVDRFGAAFLGVGRGTVEEDATYYVPAGDGSVAIHSRTWRLARPARGARALGQLGTTPLLAERLRPAVAAVVHAVGRGRVAYVPFDLFRFFSARRYPMARVFAGQVLRALAGRPAIAVAGPAGVDVVLRRRGERLLVHLVNRTSGIPGRPNDGTVDEIPAVGPVTVTARLLRRPRQVRLAFERAPLRWTFGGGRLRAEVERVHIHAALVIDT